MKKLLFFLLSLFCCLTISYADIGYEQKWVNDKIPEIYINHLLQIKDGLIVGGTNEANSHIQLIKYDKDGKEIKNLNLDYEGYVASLLEKDGKYYVITSNEDNNSLITIYEITSDLVIVRKKETGYHFGAWQEVVDLIDDTLYITSRDNFDFSGILDNDSVIYDYISVELGNFGVEKGHSDNWDFSAFSNYTRDYINLNNEGKQVLFVKGNEQITIVGSSANIDNTNKGYLAFYNKKDSIIDDFNNQKYLSIKDLGENYSNTKIGMLDDYIVVAGDNYSNLDFYDNSGKLVESINLIDYLELKNNMQFNIVDLIFKEGKLSVSYSKCLEGRCQFGILVMQKKYEIQTQTIEGEHGKIELSKTLEYGDEEVTMNIIPDEGYELGVLKIIDQDGNAIPYEGNSFVMPYADVMVEAAFVAINPETIGGVAIIGMIVLLLTSLIIAIINVKKARDLL